MLVCFTRQCCVIRKDNVAPPRRKADVAFLAETQALVSSSQRFAKNSSFLTSHDYGTSDSINVDTQESTVLVGSCSSLLSPTDSTSASESLLFDSLHFD
eukprot:m.19068 g.19068  ORF g.19068 m.19068 type:complete len:99 (+) comp27779_c0_seq5:920-1216(+)